MEDILIKIGKVTTDYYRQLNQDELTEREFNLWIESLEEPIKSSFKPHGLDKCKKVLNFQRFVLELQDKSLEEYLKTNLTEEEYSYYSGNK
jgi:hypothetical protein